MKNKSTLAFIICCLFFFSAKRLTASTEQPLLYFILDASGSMWGRVEGTTKIEIAKDTLAKLIREMPKDTASGLTVYGHRRQSDCTDIEEIIAASALDRQQAQSEIKRILPKGKTPISDSIQFVASRFKDKAFDATIVLISDGLETCAKDPCALTKSLRESGAKFILHVVGFGVGDEAREQLSCIAKAGDGQYFIAKNAGELLSVLNKVKESTLSKLPLVAPTAAPIAEVKEELKTSASSLRVKAKGPGRIKLVLDSWVKAPYYWRLLDPESGEEKGRFKTLDEQLLPAGSYQIAWRQTEHENTEVSLGEVVTVESGKLAEPVLKTAFHPLPADWVLPNYYYISLIDQKTGTEVARFKDAGFNPQLVPHGTYRVLMRQTEHQHSDAYLGDIEIKDALLNDFSLNTGVKIIPSAGLKPPYKVEFIWLGNEAETFTPKVTVKGNFDPLLLHSGHYKVNYQQSEHGSALITIVDDLNVAAGALVEVEL